MPEGGLEAGTAMTAGAWGRGSLPHARRKECRFRCLAPEVRLPGGAARGLEALVRWALEQVRAAGKRYLRLDCAAERPKLRAFYESLGFEYHSDWWLGSFHAARYQLEMSGGP